LWIKYSNGRFGFSVQKKIYQALGGAREFDYDIWCKFGETVGWKNEENWLSNKDIIFDIKAPNAHLPVKYLLMDQVCLGGDILWFYLLGYFFSRQDL
jgi:hypothetical protein